MNNKNENCYFKTKIKTINATVQRNSNCNILCSSFRFIQPNH